MTQIQVDVQMGWLRQRPRFPSCQPSTNKIFFSDQPYAGKILIVAQYVPTTNKTGLATITFFIKETFSPPIHNFFYKQKKKVRVQFFLGGGEYAIKAFNFRSESMTNHNFKISMINGGLLNDKVEKQDVICFGLQKDFF